MRIAIFFDGKNFYEAARSYDPGIDMDFERFAEWVTEAVGGPGAQFVGAYYYTGYSANPAVGPMLKAHALAEFLDYLSFARGFFVRREPRVTRVTVCKNCRTSYDYTTEKRVDTRMVAELIQLGAVNAYDIAVIASGDDDFVPAVEAVGKLGKQVYVGLWPGQGISRDLRAGAFGRLDFSTGVDRFARGRRAASVTPTGIAAAPRVEAPLATAVEGSSTAERNERVEAATLRELQAAEAQLAYVSRWYFVNRWRGIDLPVEVIERERVIDHLIDRGLVQEYMLNDPKGRITVALRMVSREEPDVEAIPPSEGS